MPFLGQGRNLNLRFRGNTSMSRSCRRWRNLCLCCPLWPAACRFLRLWRLLPNRNLMTGSLALIFLGRNPASSGDDLELRSGLRSLPSCHCNISSFAGGSNSSSSTPPTYGWMSGGGEYRYSFESVWSFFDRNVSYSTGASLSFLRSSETLLSLWRPSSPRWFQICSFKSSASKRKWWPLPAF